MTTLLDEKEVIARCAAAGIQWLAPQVSDQHGPLVGVFSGAFMANMQKLLSEALRTPSAAGVPEGWRLVPIEPTEEMILAGLQGDVPEDTYARDIYEAMLAAAPVAPIAQAAAPVDASTEPIYQRRRFDGSWIDASMPEYEDEEDHLRRIVYAAPAPHSGEAGENHE